MRLSLNKTGNHKETSRIYIFKNLKCAHVAMCDQDDMDMSVFFLDDKDTLTLLQIKATVRPKRNEMYFVLLLSLVITKEDKMSENNLKCRSQQNLNWPLPMSCFEKEVQFKTPKYSVYRTNKISKSSHLRNWNQCLFFALT